MENFADRTQFQINQALAAIHKVTPHYKELICSHIHINIIQKLEGLQSNKWKVPARSFQDPSHPPRFHLIYCYTVKASIATQPAT